MKGNGHGPMQSTLLAFAWKTMKNLSQDSWPLGQELNPGPPTYEAGVLMH
jgi:hypothetical protein